MISMVKVSIEAFWKNASIYYFKNVRNQKLNSKKANMNHWYFWDPSKTANYGQISKFKVSMEESWQKASIYYVKKTFETKDKTKKDKN